MIHIPLGCPEDESAQQNALAAGHGFFALYAVTSYKIAPRQGLCGLQRRLAKEQLGALRAGHLLPGGLHPASCRTHEAAIVWRTGVAHCCGVGNRGGGPRFTS